MSFACPLCDGEYNISSKLPILLPCNHDICKECVHDVYAKNNQHLKCEICGAVHTDNPNSFRIKHALINESTVVKKKCNSAGCNQTNLSKQSDFCSEHFDAEKDRLKRHCQDKIRESGQIISKWLFVSEETKKTELETLQETVTKLNYVISQLEQKRNDFTNAMKDLSKCVKQNPSVSILQKTVNDLKLSLNKDASFEEISQNLAKLHEVVKTQNVSQPRLNVDLSSLESSFVKIMSHLNVNLNLAWTDPNEVHALSRFFISAQNNSVMTKPEEMVIWEIENCKEKKFGSSYIKSPYFYTSEGYKLRLTIFLNGREAGFGSDVSVYISLLQGDQDSQLSWPFLLTLRVDVLGKIEPNGPGFLFALNHVPTENVKCFMHPVSSSNAHFGVSKVISQDKAYSNEYLTSCDSLLIRVQVVQDPSKPKDSLLPDTSMILQSKKTNILRNGSLYWIVDMTHMSHQDNSFYSPPFLAERYKLRLRLAPAGCGSARNNYVSLYFELMPSSHDNDLSWPCALELQAVLLNRNNQTEKKHSIQFNAKLHKPEKQSPFKKPHPDKDNPSVGRNKFVLNDIIFQNQYFQNNKFIIRIDDTKLTRDVNF